MDGLRDPRPPVPAAPLGRATPLSRSGGRALPIRRLALLACASLSLGVAVMSSGCLITDPPQFKLPTHTRPLLDPTFADPDPGAVKVVRESQIQTPITFSAEVISQEDAADTGGAYQRLEAWLYIDYGSTLDPQLPYSFAIPASIKVGTNGKRRVSATWRPASPYSDLGCHRATLVVSHIFDDTLCPVCTDDYSTLTWQILRCDESKGDCGALVLSGTGSCEGLTNTCADARQRQAESGLEPRMCPDDDTADGGSP